MANMPYKICISLTEKDEGTLGMDYMGEQSLNILNVKIQHGCLSGREDDKDQRLVPNMSLSFGFGVTKAQ